MHGCCRPISHGCIKAPLKGNAIAALPSTLPLSNRSAKTLAVNDLIIIIGRCNSTQASWRRAHIISRASNPLSNCPHHAVCVAVCSLPCLAAPLIAFLPSALVCICVWEAHTSSSATHFAFGCCLMIHACAQAPEPAATDAASRCTHHGCRSCSQGCQLWMQPRKRLCNSWLPCPSSGTDASSRWTLPLPSRATPLWVMTR